MTTCLVLQSLNLRRKEKTRERPAGDEGSHLICLAFLLIVVSHSFKGFLFKHKSFWEETDNMFVSFESEFSSLLSHKWCV